jgi:hypothetical protein
MEDNNILYAVTNFNAFTGLASKMPTPGV